MINCIFCFQYMQVLTKYQSSFILCVIFGGVGHRIKSVSTFAFFNSTIFRPIDVHDQGAHTMRRERRICYRRKINLPFVYTVSGNHFTATRKATTGDLSDSGVCLYTDVDLKKGFILELSIPEVFDSPRKCTVKWCLRKYFSNFKVGVSFDETDRKD